MKCGPCPYFSYCTKVTVCVPYVTPWKGHIALLTHTHPWPVVLKNYCIMFYTGEVKESSSYVEGKNL